MESPHSGRPEILLISCHSLRCTNINWSLLALVASSAGSTVELKHSGQVFSRPDCISTTQSSFLFRLPIPTQAAGVGNAFTTSLQCFSLDVQGQSLSESSQWADASSLGKRSSFRTNTHPATLLVEDIQLMVGVICQRRFREGNKLDYYE